MPTEMWRRGIWMNFFHASAAIAFALSSISASAADYPAPKQGDWIARDFRFHTGEVMPELRLHYTTVGEPSGEPVLILHGTTGSGASMLSRAFAGELFGPGQPLDASRYFIILPDAIRNAPDWNNGNYTTQPRAFRVASVFFSIATSGGTLAYQKLAPTRALADKLLDERLAAPFAADANDFLYQWESSRDYDPSSGLERIAAALLAINSADDERNPPETGTTARALARVKNARLLLIPASEETRGHGTTSMARFWKHELQQWLPTVPRRAM